MAKIGDVGTVQFNDGYIEIQATPVFVYEIEVRQLASDHADGRMNWLEHLRAKNWFTQAMEAKLLSHTKRLGLELKPHRDPDDAA